MTVVVSSCSTIAGPAIRGPARSWRALVDRRRRARCRRSAPARVRSTAASADGARAALELDVARACRGRRRAGWRSPPARRARSRSGGECSVSKSPAQDARRSRCQRRAAPARTGSGCPGGSSGSRRRPRTTWSSASTSSASSHGGGLLDELVDGGRARPRPGCPRRCAGTCARTRSARRRPGSRTRSARRAWSARSAGRPR